MKEPTINHIQQGTQIRRLKNIAIGTLVSGVVFKKKLREIFVELSDYGTGRIYGLEYTKAKNLIGRLKEGDEVIVKITGFDDGEGNYEISLQDITEINKWGKIKNLMRNKEILEVLVIEANKGGLIVKVEGIRGFVPVSQLTPEYYPRIQSDDKNLIFNSLKQLLGKTLALRIIAADPGAQKLILSERAAKSEAYGNELKNYSVGQIISGIVVGISNFGIFVRFHENPPIEGLIHVSEIPEKIQVMQEKLKIGDKIEAKIIKIEEDRVNLTLKDLVEDPWFSFVRQHNVGDIVEGVISEKNQDIFAIVLVNDVKGVVFENVEEFEIGASYKFRIKDLNTEEKKLILFYEK